VSRYEAGIAALEQAALDGAASVSTDLRRAVAFGGEAPEPLAAYADKVRRHAYKVVDADFARLREAGYSEDEIFEATAAAAVGAGLTRLRAALQALEGR
jgi:alkylhydroperoxidase family enzyme